MRLSALRSQAIKLRTKFLNLLTLQDCSMFPVKVRFILVSRGRDPFGQHQQSRPLQVPVFEHAQKSLSVVFSQSDLSDLTVSP